MKKMLFVLALVAAMPLWAQQNINEKRPASKDGVVEVHNVAGSVIVTGWDGDEVTVKGTLGRGSERLEFNATGSRTTIRVVIPHHAHDVDGTDLEIKVPRGSRLEVSTVSADVRVGEVVGALDLQTVSGEIEATGTSEDVNAHTVSGSLTLEVVARRLRARSVSGDVNIRKATGEVEMRSVSGRADFRSGGEVTELDAETTSGRIRLDVTLGKNANCDVRTVSGDVEIVVPASVGGSFDVSTFSGGIDNDFGKRAERTSEYGPGKELSFNQPGGDARVRIKTMSGSVSIRKR